MSIYIVAPAVFIAIVLVLYTIPKIHFRRMIRGRLFEDYLQNEDARRADGATVCIHCQSDRIWYQPVYRNLANGINRHWCRNCSRELYFTVYGDRMRKGLKLPHAGAAYVLHCFQKKSKSGIATTQQDIELIKTRLKQAEAHAKKEKHERNRNQQRQRLCRLEQR